MLLVLFVLHVILTLHLALPMMRPERSNLMTVRDSLHKRDSYMDRHSTADLQILAKDMIKRSQTPSERLTALEDRQERLETLNSALKWKSRNLQLRNQDLASRLAQIKSTVELMESELRQVAGVALHNGTDLVNGTDDLRTQFERTIASMKKKDRALQADISSATEILIKLRGLFSKQIGFNSYLESTATWTTTTAFTFDIVILNKGSAYNSYNYLFTAPFSGIYAFYFQGRGVGSAGFHGYINVNGVKVCSTFAGGNIAPASCQAVVHMSQSDVAKVENVGSAFVHNHASFAGYLVAVDTQR